jgi:hypothetical protein
MEEERRDPPADEQPTSPEPESAASEDGPTDDRAAPGAEATEVSAQAEADDAEMAALVSDLEAVAEAADRAIDEGDTAFSEDLDPETRAFGAPKPQAVVCQWCNGPLESVDLEVCPHCGSRLKPTDENLVVPGVTTLSSEAARALELAEIQRNREAAKSGQAMYTTPSLAAAEAIVPAPDEATIEAANRPPDEEVRRLMLEMEQEARRARAEADARLDVESLIVADAEERIEAAEDAAEGAPDAADPGEAQDGSEAQGATGPSEPDTSSGPRPTPAS